MTAYHPIHILAVWADARAILWRAGEIGDIQDAVAPLLDFCRRCDIAMTVAAAVLRDVFPECEFNVVDATDTQDGGATVL